MPRLQIRDWEDSRSDDDSAYHRGDDELGPRAIRIDAEYRLDSSDNK